MKIKFAPSFTPLFISCGGVFLILLTAMPLAFAQGGAKLKVLATLFPLQEFARAAGGDRVQADLLLPPGVEPHTWDPKPSEVARIARADVFIYIGPMMEPWAEGLLQAAHNPKLKTVQASRGLTLLEAGVHKSDPHRHPGKHRKEPLDPHIWLDFSLDLQIVDAIAAAFSAQDPDGASFYQVHSEDYKKALLALDQKYRETLSRCRTRQIFLGGHSAFAYLAGRYGLEQVALYGLSPNAEPTPKRLASVIQAAKRHQARYIFFESLVNPKLARVLAKEAGLGTLVLHAGHNLTRDQQKEGVRFLDLMEANLENLGRGLDCHEK